MTGDQTYAQQGNMGNQCRAGGDFHIEKAAAKGGSTQHCTQRGNESFKMHSYFHDQPRSVQGSGIDLRRPEITNP
jgi:hypothetical protein